MWRVLQIGLGPLGVKIASDLHQRRIGTVVAAVDPAHAGSLVAGTDVKVAATLDEVAVPVDIAIVATLSDLRHVAPTLRALAERGISAVSTCEELSWPWDRHPQIAKELDALAVRQGVRMLGTGVNPGFVMDALAVAITTACAEVRRVEIHRIQDAAHRRLPFQKKIGATLAVGEFERLAAAGTIRHVGLRESVGMIAASLGLAFDRVDESIAPVIAERDMTCGLGLIAAGAVRGVHQEAHAWAGEREVIRLIFHAAIGELASQDRIIVDGNPPVDLVIRGGLHGDVATSAITLNAIRALLAAKPGLHTMSTLPLSGCAPPS